MVDKEPRLDEDLAQIFVDIAQHALDGIWVTDREGRLVFLNEAMAELADVQACRVRGSRLFIDHELERFACFEDHFRKAEELLIPVEFEIDLVTAEGRKTSQSGWCIPRVKDGSYTGMICTMKDITIHKEVETALRMSETLLDRTGQMARVGGWEVDARTLEVSWTRETYRIHEVPFGEKPALDEALNFWHPEDRPVLRDALERALSSAEPYDLELRLISAKGRELYARTICRPIVEMGQVVKLEGTFQDISARKQAQMQLESIFENSLALICIADITTATFTKVNPAFRATLGYDDEELLSRPFLEFVHPDDVEPTQRVVEECLLRGEKVFSFENRYRHKDGSYRWLLWNSHPRPELGRTYAVAVDITENKHTEEALQRTQKLESLGILAGGIAHDFNNLLGGIFGNIDLARMAIEEPERATHYLGRAVAAMERAQNLTHQLLTFARGGEPQKTAVELAPLLDESRALALSGSNVSCNIHIDEDVGGLDADPNQINQVFNNVLLNARQAMPDGGRVSMTASRLVVAENETPGLESGEYVKITVSDDGPGVPADAVPRVFDPFFSRKAGGSGLGLATSHSIVRKHGGTIRLDSEVGCGTTVTILLPAALQDPVGKQDEARETGMFSGRVLVMDDEEVVRSVISEMLQSVGFDVVCTRSGQEAIDTFTHEARAGRPFDLMMLDLTVPGGLGGEQVMATIASSWPEAIGVVTSGYADSPVLADPARFGFAAKLAKPYRLRDLSELLDQLFGQSSGQHEDPNG